MDLENWRFVYIVSVLRSIFMKPIYQDKYPVIDTNMTQILEPGKRIISETTLLL